MLRAFLLSLTFLAAFGRAFAAGPEALSAASAHAPFADFGPVRLGIVEYVRPAPSEVIVEATIDTLRDVFGEERLVVTRYALGELAQAIETGAVDVFLSSAGFYVRMIPYGARDLATAVSENYPDPNHCDASAIVVLDERRDLRTIADLEGKRLVTSSPTAFTGLQIPQGEILRAGFNPEKFFRSTRFLGGGSAMREALPMILRGEADVGFFRLCFLEQWVAAHPADKGRFRVIGRKDTDEKPEPCERSTDLYPTWTMATTRATDPRLSRLVTRAVLQMKPAGEEGLSWGVATDYSAVNDLFRALRIGPFEHLRHWTVRRIFTEYGHFVFLALMLLLGLVGHSVRVSSLVRRRTRALTEALERQKELAHRARKAQERLEQMSRAGVVMQLSAIFAHEMRQPLGAISLYGFALKKLVTSRVWKPEKALEVLGKLSEQTERANEIVANVRTYAKGQAPGSERVSLKETIDRAVADLQTSGRWRTPVLLGPVEEAEIEANPLEMELVAVNLIKNALQALENCPDGRVVVSLRREADRVLLMVQDNGPDIPDEVFSNLANSFQSTKSEGLGLGLSIVHGIIERLAGRLEFLKLPGGGLVAVVTLPLETPEAEIPGNPGEQAPAS